MAITKIHAIKTAPGKAIEYICNEKKTDGNTLISSFATSPETAVDDFRFTLSHTDSMNPNKAYHLIQSFSPGEVTPGEAHIIGNELADRILGGKYSYIVSTHIDKGHVHNHIIFCAANNFDYRKYNDSKRSYWKIRNISDELCTEHNLSIINGTEYKAKTYKEWLEEHKGTSWKSILRQNINTAVRESKTYEEFLEIMRSRGYEIKDSGFGSDDHKYIGFRAPGQTRWIRGRTKSLGAEYTKERIRERIEERAKVRADKMLKPADRSLDNISLINKSDPKFDNAPALQRWADKHNLKMAAKIMSRLAELNLQDPDKLNGRIESLHQQSKNARKTVREIDKKIKICESVITYSGRYNANKEYDIKYNQAKDKDRYYRNHSEQLSLAWGAKDQLKHVGIDPDKTDLKEFEVYYDRLLKDRAAALSTYKDIEKQCDELRNMRAELNKFMNTELSNTVVSRDPISL